MPNHLRYADGLETVKPDEAETFRKITQTMADGMHTVREKNGHDKNIRVSHAKAHAFLKGELAVDAGLPPELAQGFFAAPGSHEVLARLAAVPGEVLDDRRVHTQRGMALKIFGVESVDGGAYDLVLNNGKAFIAADAGAFLLAFQPNARLAPRMSEGTKGLASKGAEAANKVLGAVGFPSGKLDFYGHPNVHPLGESHYSQAPIRYGDYVAKLSVTPANPELEALIGQKVDVDDKNALRVVTSDYFKANGAAYDLNVQLALDDRDAFPIEDASVEWPEDQSPYRRVARLTFPPQDSFDPARQDVVDYRVSFSPAHAPAAHRPLGSIMRARMAVYPALQRTRHGENNEAELRPESLADVPG